MKNSRKKKDRHSVWKDRNQNKEDKFDNNFNFNSYSSEWPSPKAPRLEMEFLDIKFTKALNLLLHAIHSPFYWQILKNPYSSLVLKALHKNRETKKLESIHE